MSRSSDTLKKQEEIASNGQQRTYKQDEQGMDIGISKGVETKREAGSKRPPTGA